MLTSVELSYNSKRDIRAFKILNLRFYTCLTKPDGKWALLAHMLMRQSSIHQHMHICKYGCVYIYMCINIYAVIIWAKFGQVECCYLGQVCLFLNTCLSKRSKIWGFSTFCETQHLTHQNFEGLLSGPSWPFFVAADLAQIIELTWPR